MTQIDVNNLLSQMRQMTAQTRMPEKAFSPAAAGAAPGVGDFSALLRKSISAVGQTQLEAGRMTTSFERGDPGVSLASTMIAVQKADLSLRTMVQVQSKLVDAYKQIMNMSV